MIYFSGLSSIIESIYLGDRLGTKIGECDVFVNPKNPKYLVGKLVIINSTDYPQDQIPRLIENENKVVSRIKIEEEGILFQPYIIRVDLGIMYNGRNLEELVTEDRILQEFCSFPESTLLFPKLNPSLYPVTDSEGNLTGLGWALHQVGVKVRDGLEFQNLDIVKLGKLKF